MQEVAPNFDDLFDADAYWAAGHLPWSLTGYDDQFADSAGRPLDAELLRFLALLQSCGVRFGIWRADFLRPGHSFVVAPIEDMRKIMQAIQELEQSGAIPTHHVSQLSRRLTSPK